MRGGEQRSERHARNEGRTLPDSDANKSGKVNCFLAPYMVFDCAIVIVPSK